MGSISKRAYEVITIAERLSSDMARLELHVLKLSKDVDNLRDEVAGLLSSMKGCAFFGEAFDQDDNEKPLERYK